MIRSAEDARKLANRFGEKPPVYKAVSDLIQTKIGTAAKSGLSQVTIELSYSTYKATDIDELKRELKEAGYSYMAGSTEGYLGSNLFREAKYCITVMW